MLHENRVGLAPLPARTPSSSWEDLASLVSRTAVCMGYKNPQWILHPEENPSAIHPFNLCMLRERRDYQFLEQLLLLDEEALYSLSLHRFAVCLQTTEHLVPENSSKIQRPLLSRSIFQTFFRPYSATAVCSVCLTEEPAYSRLYWGILPVVACLRHNIFLTYQCPTCLCSIPLLRPSLNHCPRCKQGDYRAAPTVSLSQNIHFQEGQAHILRQLGIEEVKRNADVGSKDVSPLLKLLPYHYFQLLDAFRCIFGPLFPHACFLQVEPEARMFLRRHPRPHSTLSLFEWSVIIATFHWLFQTWPNNFFTFLDAFPHTKSSRVRRRDQERMTGLQHDFGVLYEKWLYKRLMHPSFAFLQEAFEDYLRVRYTTGEVTRRLLPFKGKPEVQNQERPYLTKLEARKLLGIGETALQSLFRQGSLHVVKKPIGRAMKRNMFLIERACVVALQQTWATLISLEDVARIHLGTTKAVVLALEDAGMLLPIRGPKIDGYKLRFYNPTAIKEFEELVLMHAVKLQEEPSETIIPLTVFASKAGVPLVTLLKEILNGHLLPFTVGVNQPLFQRLTLSKGEVGTFLDTYKQRQRKHQELFTSREVAMDLDISEKTLRRWVQWGLIEGNLLRIGGKRPTLLFLETALEHFHSTYMTTTEVAHLLGVALATVSKYVRKGKLHPVVGRKTQYGGTKLIFKKEEVLNMAANRKAKHYV